MRVLLFHLKPLQFLLIEVLAERSDFTFESHRVELNGVKLCIAAVQFLIVSFFVVVELPIQTMYIQVISVIIFSLSLFINSPCKNLYLLYTMSIRFDH